MRKHWADLLDESARQWLAANPHAVTALEDYRSSHNGFLHAAEEAFFRAARDRP